MERINWLKTLDLILSLSKDEAKLSCFFRILLILGLKFPDRIMLERIPAAQAGARLGLAPKGKLHRLRPA